MHLFLTGEVLNIFCYVHIVCDFVIICIVLLLFLLLYPCFAWKDFGPQEINLSTTTSLMEQKHSFVWTQINVISNSINITHYIQQWNNTLLLVLRSRKIPVCKCVTINFAVIIFFLAIDQLLNYLS